MILVREFVINSITFYSHLASNPQVEEFSTTIPVGTGSNHISLMQRENFLLAKKKKLFSLKGIRKRRLEVNFVSTNLTQHQKKAKKIFFVFSGFYDWIVADLGSDNLTNCFSCQTI